MKMELEIDFELVCRELEEASKHYHARNPSWTEKELALLRQFYGHVATVLLAKKLGHTAQACRDKASELGINKVR